MLRLARSLVQTFTGVASGDFNDWVEARNDGRGHPTFFDGTFAEALAATTDPSSANGGRGLMLVWLHEQENDACLRLCTDVWPNPGILAELHNRFVTWAGDVCRFEAGAIGKILGARSYPALAALQAVPRGTPGALEWPLRCYFRVLWLTCDRLGPQELLNALRDVAEGNDAERSQAAQWQREINQMRDFGEVLSRAFSGVRAENEQRAARARTLHDQEADERCCFAAVYESRHGVEPPPYFDGDFAEALAAAKAEQRLLLVWLYGQHSDLNDAFCEQVISNEVFAAFLSEYYVLYPGDAERWLLPSRICEVLRWTSLPALLVLQPLSAYDTEVLPWADPRAGAPVEFPADSAWAMLGSWDMSTAGVDQEAILSFLAEHGDRAKEQQRHRDLEQRGARERAEQARLLREQQDLEFEESLRRDAEREAANAARAEEEKAQKAEADAAKAAADAAKSAADAAAAALKERRQVAATGLLNAPIDSAAEKCRLVLRLPSGPRPQRTFGADDPLSTVYIWADCCGELSEMTKEGNGFEVPQNFTIARAYPRAVLQDNDMTLRELGLCPDAVLYLCPE